MRHIFFRIAAFLALLEAASAEVVSPPGKLQQLSSQTEVSPGTRLADGPGDFREQPPTAESSAARTDEFGEQIVLRRRAHVEPWSVSVEAGGFYTDNAALTPDDPHGDWYLRSGANVSYTNRIRSGLFVDFSLQQYQFRYAEFNILDFDLTRAEASLLLQAPALANAFFYVRYSLERITEPYFGSALYTDHSLEGEVQKVWKVSRGQQFFGSLSADFSLDTDPKFASRHEYAATVGYFIRLTNHLSAALSCRSSFFDYVHVHREDWTQVISAGVTYDFTPWLRVGSSLAYTNNHSTRSATSYQSLVPGGLFSVQAAF